MFESNLIQLVKQRIADNITGSNGPQTRTLATNNVRSTNNVRITIESPRQQAFDISLTH